MSGIVDAIFGGGESTVTQTSAPRSQEEIDFIKVQTELANLQLQNLQGLQPFQRELIELTLSDLQRQRAERDAVTASMSPEELAQFQRDEFDRARRLGPIQDEMLQLQLDSLRRGGAATPEQLALIKQAADRGIEAGSADIDMTTKRGIGLISDELANSRGLRLTDTPILREATLLSRSGQDQKASLVKNLRAGEATAALNYPLAVQQLNSGINLNQQSVLQNAAQFNADLRQRAYQNRLALTGQASNTGLGLASFGGQQPGYTGGGTSYNSRSPSGAETLQTAASLATGIGALMAFSDRRLKKDYGVVGKTAGGVPLHVYRYKGEGDRDPLRLGVMAQEVEKVKPEAVKRHKSGYLAVDLERLFDGDGIGLVPA